MSLPWFGTLYNGATCSVTLNSTAVTVAGTDLIAAGVGEVGFVGQGFQGPDLAVYEIASINSFTSLTLARNYLGSTVASGGTFAIAPLQGYTRDAAYQLSALLALLNETITGIDSADIDDRLDALEANSGTPGLNFSTRALLYADLAHIANTVAFVNFDATTDYNGKYIKVGGSGAGSWSKVDDGFDLRIDQNEALDSSAKAPFLPAVDDDYMRKITNNLWIEGGDVGHAYVWNYETLDLGSGNGRVRFKIYDATLGIHVCTWIGLDTQANFNAITSPTVLLFQADLAGYTGITATAWINWSSVTDWTKTLTTYTSPNDGGIRTDRIITPGEIRERFKRGAEPKILLTVGTGTPTSTHFNSVLAAVQSLYLPGVAITRSTYPLSDICTFSNQVLVAVITDGHDDTITLTTIGAVDQSPLVLPPFITLRGLSNTDTRIKASHATNSGPVIEAPFPFRIEQMRVENLGAGGGYAVHIDNQNDRAKRSTAAGDKVVLRYPMVSVFKKATLMSTSASTWVIGCGISNGHTIRLEQCRVFVPTSRAGLGVHNVPSTTDPGEIEVIDTYFSDAGADAISLVKGTAMTVQHRLLVQGSDLDEIVLANTVGGAAGFIREGKIDAGITITGTLDT